MDFLTIFSSAAVTAISRLGTASEEGRRQYRSPGDIFLHMLHMSHCYAMRVMMELKIDMAALGAEIKAGLSSLEAAEPPQETINLMDEAYKEMKRRKDSKITTLHLLIAMSTERRAGLYHIFERHGLTATAIRQVSLAEVSDEDMVSAPACHETAPEIQDVT